MGSTRIKGTALALQLGTPAVDYWADATSVVLDNEEADQDTVTFEDAAAGGGRQYFLQITALQSTATGSFWRMVWDQAGEEVPFTYAPHGNETATAAQPHFLGTCKIAAKPRIGGDAGTSNTYTFEIRLDVIGEPVLDDGS